MGSLRMFLEQEEVCASGCFFGNECLHTPFHSNILATGGFLILIKKQSKRTTITSFCFMILTANQTGIFQMPLSTRHFFQNGTRCPCPECLSSLAGETVKYKYPGQKWCETHCRDSGEGAIIKKLHQRADVRKRRGHDYERDLTHHSSLYTLIHQT